MAAKREQIVAEHAEKTELHRRTQTNADPETVACAPRAPLSLFARELIVELGGRGCAGSGGPSENRS